MIELEKTYLVKELPKGLESCEYKEIIDIYIPEFEDHPTLRIRKNGERYVITKKELVNGTDSSELRESTIVLRKDEFEVLNKVEGKKVRKLRYRYDFNGQIAEFDIFQDDLFGLVVVDFEFEERDAKNNFKMPDFCLEDVTQEAFIAGGMICGKKYKDVEEKLNSFNYKKLFLNN